MALNGLQTSLNTSNNALTPELVAAIQRVLDIQPGQTTDPLDALSADFDPVDTLNTLFPDGEHCLPCFYVVSL